MQITILQVKNSTVPTNKGSYQVLEVDYKEVNGGKVGSKKIMSFVQTSKPAFDVLSTASPGETYEVGMVKEAGRDGKEYWVFNSATKGTGAAAQTATQGNSGTATVAKGNWETSEERAKKQIYIIRQSSISSAISALAVGSKTPAKPDEILSLAKRFEDYVFDGLTGNFAVDTAALEDENLFQDLPQ